MFATNHGLAGMVIGAAMPPIIALPVALGSHFFMDSLPHYGIAKNRRNKVEKYKRIVMFDTVAVLSLNVIAIYFRRWDMLVFGWVAYAPDLYWVYLFFKQKGSLNFRIKHKYAKFHHRIQREYEDGWLVEIPISILLFLLLRHFILSS